ncbi:uncharacterized protein Z520_02291 [Fonsecaea multimorphosa CBS 102226]|uniref:HypA-like protein n=1 Tax=Fonsecaea multimorphosa CBS 102226 TaxID=1442371 RepID=A0A0D2K7V5_9EURO|nr:uncharacterized protein Z520_02291 [Fonsecaea multimorphosa CBS 102226]KIY02153.1 hypothetical protein Z520_02291 [Fonsecaea multimorphosa CBS 102226]OAL29348.1 hypothetical protein AYO22_02242 [Fonsecaea multimorphosa]
MATASKIHLSTDVPAIVRVKALDRDATDTTNKLLNHNHTTHDIIFDDVGRHNHIVHHTLASFALGADAAILQKQYDQNARYQRAPPPADENIINALDDDPKTFLDSMAKPENYSSFLTYFTNKLSSGSIPDVLNEYVFSDTELARTIFNRFFAGYYHPLIHLGYGVEFQQPAIVAEALAQACVHSTYLDAFFDLTASAAEKTTTPDTMVNLLRKIREDTKVSTAVHWTDGQKVRDGVLARARDEMVSYAAQWKLSPPYTQQGVEEAAAEVINAAAYFTGAAQNPPRVVKMDFFYMHAVNSSIFLSAFLAQDWISLPMKAKLVEWKGRLDLALYASRRCPKLLLEEIANYPPTGGSVLGWDEMYRTASRFMDDGHTAKFIRALANGERVCKPFENGSVIHTLSSPETNGQVNGHHTNGDASRGDGENEHDDDRWKIKGDMWLRLAMMVLDSVQPENGERWARSVGFEEAWEDFVLRKDHYGKNGI